MRIQKNMQSQRLGEGRVKRGLYRNKYRERYIKYRDKNETVAEQDTKKKKNIETETETEAEKGNRDRNSVFQ